MVDDQKERASDLFFSNNPNIMREVTDREVARIEEVLTIMRQIKTPSSRNIGLDGSRAVWLIALHNCSYKDSGRLILKKMQQLYYRDRSQVFYPGIPYLVDRVMLNSKQFDHKATQRFGTQAWHTVIDDGRTDSGVFPIIDTVGLSERRKKYGLATKPKLSGSCRHTA